MSKNAKRLGLSVSSCTAPILTTPITSTSLLEHQRALKIKLPQTSFHSLRVNVITELHNKDANAGKILKIVGHEDGSGGQAVHWGYVRDQPDFKSIMDLLNWPIDREALKYDGRFKDFVSDPKNWAEDKQPGKGGGLEKDTKKKQKR
jgi:hypothetical protein